MAVVHLLDEALGTVEDDCSTLVRIRRPGTDVEIGLRPLEPGEHPTSALFGFRADDDWHAIGVIATGRAHALIGTRAPVAVRVIHVVDRSGTSVSRLRGLDGTDMPSPVGGGGGLIDDCCRRALDLPTPPPPVTPLAGWAAIWLDRVLAEALAEPSRHWCWADLARHHPLAPRGQIPAEPRVLADRIRIEASSASWDEMRQTAARHAIARDLTPAVRRWMDEGMFARWMLAGVPGADELLDELTALLPSHLLDAISAALEAWHPCPTPL